MNKYYIIYKKTYMLSVVDNVIPNKEELFQKQKYDTVLGNYVGSTPIG